MAHLLVNNSNFDYTIKIGGKLVKIESKKYVEIKQEHISELNKKIKNFNKLFITSKKEEEEVKKDEKKTENKKEDKKSENKTEENK